MLVAVDIDGILTIETCWTEEQCLNATPNTEVIDYINSIYGKNIIIIYTARTNELRNATEYWLKNNGIKYHALRMDKMGCDILIDDKTVNNLEDLKKII